MDNAVGRPPEGVSSSSVYLEATEADHPLHWGPLNDLEMVPKTSLQTGAGGDPRYSSIRWQVDGVVAYVDRWNASDEEIASDEHAGWPIIDVRVYEVGGPRYGAIWWDGSTGLRIRFRRRRDGNI